jgi:hypothetical protein
VDFLQRHHATARELTRRQSTIQKNLEIEMSQFTDSDLRQELRDELRSATVEPLLPIEKKLIAWSLGIGLTLLVVLAVINHLYPPGS